MMPKLAWSDWVGWLILLAGGLTIFYSGYIAQWRNRQGLGLVLLLCGTLVTALGWYHLFVMPRSLLAGW